MANKRPKREKNKVNKARFARAREKALANARREASMVRCCYCTVPATRDSSDFLHLHPLVPLCSVCHDRLPGAVSAIREITQSEIDENTNNIAYHGTASVFVPDILEKGLVSRRKSAEVYYTPSVSRAETYAKSWVVGMHAGGASDSLSGAVLSFPILDGDECTREQRSDWAVSRLVVPTQLTVERRIDLGDLPQETADYIGHLMNFIGIVAWRLDAYSGSNPFAQVLQRARACYARLRSLAPIAVLRDTIYVPGV